MHNMRNQFDSQTTSESKSEHAYALVTTQGLQHDAMPYFYNAHTLAARGCPKQYRSLENLKITNHHLGYRFYSTSGAFYSTTTKSNSDGNRPEFHFEIRPKPRFQNQDSRQQIDPNLCNRQLEHVKRGRTLTCFTGIERQRRRRNDGNFPIQTNRNRGRISRFPVEKTGGSGSGLQEESIDQSRQLGWPEVAAVWWFLFG
ncbi:unnamed protein product [Prunus armeniaca]